MPSAVPVHPVVAVVGVVVVVVADDNVNNTKLIAQTKQQRKCK